MTTTKRDDKGDIVFPDISKEINDEIRNLRWTHIFHFKHSDGLFYEVDFEKHLALYEDPRKDLPKLTLAEQSLFETTFPASDEYLNSRAKYDHYINTYFRPLFLTFSAVQSHPLKIDIFKIVLEKDKLEKIKKFISENGLLEHEDFILYLIAKIEKIYIHDVEFYEEPEQLKEIRSYPNEVKNLIEILKLSETKWSDTENITSNPELSYITFHYTKRKEKSIKISDSSLKLSIPKSIKEYYNRGSLGNWEKQLLNSTSIPSENQQPREFRGRVIKSLHIFFKNTNFYDFGTKKTTDAEIYVIAGILDFSHIKFYDKKGIQYDFNSEEDKKYIKQQIRIEIERKELKYTPTHFSSTDLKIDFKPLLKYFDSPFINCINPVYSEYDLCTVGTITHSHNINHLLPLITHIFCCLKHWESIIGHQFEVLFNNEIEKNEDYNSWKKLIANFENNNCFQEVQLKLWNGGNCLFTENLSLHILEKALSEYYQNHKFEFENDFYESKIERGSQLGSYRLVTTGNLHQPYNRFLPKFCRECYQFLLCEAPPADNDFQPSEKYYSIIGHLLNEASFFQNPYIDEQFIIEQVKYWHQLK